MNGKLATKASIQCTLLKEHLYGEISFVRQAQVANIVQNSSANNLAEVIYGTFQYVVCIAGSDEPPCPCDN